MSGFGYDRETERQRYNARATRQLVAVLGPDGAEFVAPALRRPYVLFEQHIRSVARPGVEGLDLCCGDGLHSLTAAKAGARMTVSDIAENNLLVARQRAERAGLQVQTVAADAERLPLPDGSFDFVTCAGSLSYVDLGGVLREINRLLRPGGWFICVDSLNHNPVYLANRYWNYLRGRRTRSTLLRMPTLATIATLERTFMSTEVSFHGSLSFLAPLLRPVRGEDRTAEWLDQWDERHPGWRRWAFKFVFRGRKPI